jgi:capsular exopolysaccharide synthesis family protein
LVSLRDLIHLLRLHKVGIALAVIAGGITGYFAGSVLPPSYTAEGLFVVDTHELNIPVLRTITSQRTVEPWGARSEARVLTSHENVERAVLNLDLEHDPQLNGSLSEPAAHILLAASWMPNWLEAAASNLWPDARQSSEPEWGPAVRSKIVDDIRRDLKAESEERSYAILLSYRGKDPGGAAAIVNAIMDAYVVYEVDAKQVATQRASEHLRERLDQARAEWQESNEAIRAMEREARLVQTADGTITSQAMAALAIERLKLGTERARAVADRAQITAAVKDGSLNVINPELVSPRLRNFWEQEAALRIRLGELGAELGDRHPQMVALRSDVTDLEAKQVEELSRIRSSLDQHIATFEQRDRELGEAIAQADQKASATAEGRALLNQLEREAEMKRELYVQYRASYEQTLAALDMQSADVRIASRSVPPERPSSPGPNLLGAVGGAFGLLLSCSVIVSRRWLHNRFETLNELSEVTGVPGLGAVPQTSTFLRPRHKMTELVARQPDSCVAETMRGILLRIQCLGREGAVPKVLLVTSPGPTDGKTSLVVAMARIAARDGLRCLAIDCDFRRSALAKAVDAKPQHWLSDFLLNSEQRSLAGLITQERLSEALYILTRPVRPIPRQLLESPLLKAVIDGARQSCDLVLIDTPPIMNVADSMILSRFADAFVMVVSSRGADRTTVLEALHRAEVTGCPVAGLVMSRVRNNVGDNYSYAGYPASRH